MGNKIRDGAALIAAGVLIGYLAHKPIDNLVNYLKGDQTVKKANVLEDQDPIAGSEVYNKFAEEGRPELRDQFMRRFVELNKDNLVFYKDIDGLPGRERISFEDVLDQVYGGDNINPYGVPFDFKQGTKMKWPDLNGDGYVGKHKNSELINKLMKPKVNDDYINLADVVSKNTMREYQNLKG